MTLTELITKSRKDEKKIKEHHEILVAFQKAHPWIIEEARAELAIKNGINVPTVEEILKFKQDLLINDMDKVYSQVKRYNPLLVINPTNEQTLFYYTLKKDLFKKQVKSGLELGEKDTQGRLVTGSDLVIEAVVIDLKEFLNTYYAACN